MMIPGETRLRCLGLAEEEMKRLLATSAFEARELEEDFSERVGRNGVRAASLCWAHPEGAEGRCALIYSERIEILNLMIFPWASERLPVFASELILMGGRVQVAVVDWQMPEGADALSGADAAELAGLHGKWAGTLTPGGALPGWAERHFTPFCIYTRPRTEDETRAVQGAFVEYLSRWLNRCRGRWGDKKMEWCGGPALNDYLHHHVENTPGRPFLSKVFGEAWAERYFREFMYAPLKRFEIMAS